MAEMQQGQPVVVSGMPVTAPMDRGKLDALFAVLCVCGVAAFLEAAPPTLKKGWLRGGREKHKDE